MTPEERIEKIKNDIRAIGEGPCPKHDSKNMNRECIRCLLDLEREIICCDLDQLKAEFKPLWDLALNVYNCSDCCRTCNHQAIEILGKSVSAD